MSLCTTSIYDKHILPFCIFPHGFFFFQFNTFFYGFGMIGEGRASARAGTHDATTGSILFNGVSPTNLWIFTFAWLPAYATSHEQFNMNECGILWWHPQFNFGAFLPRFNNNNNYTSHYWLGIFLCCTLFGISIIAGKRQTAYMSHTLLNYSNMIIWTWRTPNKCIQLYVRIRRPM